jgi:hypothetical protein
MGGGSYSVEGSHILDYAVYVKRIDAHRQMVSKEDNRTSLEGRGVGNNKVILDSSSSNCRGRGWHPTNTLETLS